MPVVRSKVFRHVISWTVGQVAAERGATFLSVAMAQALNLGMLFSTKCNVRIKPPCNGPVHPSMITLGI
jgi:hypothetical protein